MYGKIFESIYDGSMPDNWKTMVVFQQFIILADKEGLVDMSPAGLSRRTGIPVGIINSAIDDLTQPDPNSNLKLEEGRRLLRCKEDCDRGFEVVGYKHYCGISSLEDKRENNRLRQQKHRQKNKDKDVTCGNAPSRVSHHIDEDLDINTNIIGYEEYINKNKVNNSALEERDYPFFTKFYGIFPKKKDRKRTLQAWVDQECEKIAQNKILPKLQEQIKSDVQYSGDKQFCPYPKTYIEGERWNDEIETDTDDFFYYPI